LTSKTHHKTICQAPNEVIFKDRGSKFFGYSFPIENEEDVKTHLQGLKKNHPAAKHFCYAYTIGINQMRYRLSDDGEPNNSAGQPIYGQIQSFGLTNILIVVIRYFGGTKLGVGGLIQAYRSAAKMSLELSEIIELEVLTKYSLNFSYARLNTVMAVLKKRQIQITYQLLDLDCEITIAANQPNAIGLENAFKKFKDIKLKKIND
jgi:uncharacterized YigZ family protein